MPPPFQKRITTQGGEIFKEQVYLNDVDAQDYWKFDRRGLCLKFCRAMPALWHLVGHLGCVCTLQRVRVPAEQGALEGMRFRCRWVRVGLEQHAPP